MNKYIDIAFYSLVFLPVFAVFLISYIPKKEQQLKSVISFMCAIGIFISFGIIFINYLKVSYLPKINIALFYEFTGARLSLFMDEKRIFFYGVNSLFLLIIVFFFNPKNIWQKIQFRSPFILAFLLNISIGQSELRVSLPILSVANLVIYFLISFSEQKKRGTAIFSMGSVFFCVDALALLFLQKNSQLFLKSPPIISLLVIFLPAFLRMTPLFFAPFLRKLIANMSDNHGFIIFSYLQISGFFLLNESFNKFTDLTNIFIKIIIGINVFSALFTLLGYMEKSKINELSYYLLSFFSSILICFCMLFPKEFSLSSSFFISYLLCVFCLHKSFLWLKPFFSHRPSKNKRTALWFLCVFMFLLLPFFGIGPSVWMMFDFMINLSPSSNPFIVLNFNTFVLFVFCMLIVFKIFVICRQYKYDEIVDNLEYSKKRWEEHFNGMYLLLPLATGIACFYLTKMIFLYF